MASIGQCPQLRLSRFQVAGALRLRNPRLEHRVVYWDGVDWLEGGAVRGEAEQINRIRDVTPHHCRGGEREAGRKEERRRGEGRRGTGRAVSPIPSLSAPGSPSSSTSPVLLPLLWPRGGQQVRPVGRGFVPCRVGRGSVRIPQVGLQMPTVESQS